MDINNAIYARPVSVTASATSDTNRVKEIASKETTPLQDIEAQTEDGDLKADTRDIVSVVENLNDFAQSVRRNLAFSMQNDTGKVVVEVTDSSTGELIRKIPSEEALELSERIADVRSLMTSVKA